MGYGIDPDELDECERDIVEIGIYIILVQSNRESKILLKNI